MTIIASQTATFIFSSALALVCAMPDAPPMRVVLENSVAGTLVRRILPAVIAVPILVGFVRIMGERAGYYDSVFGSAIRTIVEAGLLLALLAWTTRTIRRQTTAQDEAEARATRDAYSSGT